MTTKRKTKTHFEAVFQGEYGDTTYAACNGDVRVHRANNSNLTISWRKVTCKRCLRLKGILK